MNMIVGHTGFVGSNLYASGGFDAGFNSKNVTDAYGSSPDLLVYAGIRAEKYLANEMPERDYDQIEAAEENIEKIAPKKLVLISTIDVIKKPDKAYEDVTIDTVGLSAYGLNRYKLEQWVRGNYPDALIVRLPSLFGENIKKNFLYDIIHLVPFMLKREKYFELKEKIPGLDEYYDQADNGYYKCRLLKPEEEQILKALFEKTGFTALDFTDSRNVYQFYPLNKLWGNIKTAISNNIILLHTATEPLSAADIYYYLYGKEFKNEILSMPCFYDYRTKYSACFHGSEGYIFRKEEILKEIKKFVGGT